MRIFLDGRRVLNRKSKGWLAYYYENRAYFTKKGLTKQIVLHELYHHLIDSKALELPVRKEEKEANSYARDFLKS